MDWDKLKIFHIVAKAGSFTLAAQELNLAQSSVSRHITGLEDSLNTVLFHRHARGLALTAQGEYLYRATLDVADTLTRTQNHLTEMQDHAEGPLTITTTNFFGGSWLTEALTDFIIQNPKIKLNLRFSDHELDLSMREADIALRMTEPTKMDLIQRHLIRINFHLYAAKSYLANNPALDDIDDLQNHHIICYSDGYSGPFHDHNWILKLGKINPSSQERITRTTNLYSCLLMAKNGVGIACLPDYVACKHDELVRVIPHAERPPINCYLCYPEELKAHEKIKLFRDFILNKVKDTVF